MNPWLRTSSQEPPFHSCTNCNGTGTVREEIPDRRPRPKPPKPKKTDSKKKSRRTQPAKTSGKKAEQSKKSGSWGWGILLAIIFVAILSSEDSSQDFPSQPINEDPIEERRGPQYSSGTQPGGEQVSYAYAFCLANSSDADIVYNIKWGDGGWEQSRVEPGSSRWHWMNQSRYVNVTISYDRDATPGSEVVWRQLKGKVSSVPVSCESGERYEFIRSGNLVGLNASVWQHGWPHPFFLNVISSTTPGVWQPAEGYRFFNPEEEQDLRVVRKDLGVVGMAVSQEEVGGAVLVSQVVEGRSAERSGVLPGMQIVYVDDKAVAGLSSSDVVSMISGELGTRVVIVFFNPSTGLTFRATLDREV